MNNGGILSILIGAFHIEKVNVVSNYSLLILTKHTL